MGTYLDGRVATQRADITKLAVDAIVNAANGALSGGGGVDGAIHKAAGPELLAECRTLGRAAPGDVRITQGYRLPARFVIHAVAPVWDGGARDEDAQLARCYSGALSLLVERELATIAFPSISTGAYKFPLERAARIAQTEVRAALARLPQVRLVVFCCFSENELRAYDKIAASLLQS